VGFLCQILFFLVFLGPVHAEGPSEAAAEQERLRGELVRLYRNQTWKGVERLYMDMLHLEEIGAVLTVEDHMYGVMAAQELGMLSETVERLGRIVGLQPDSSEADWLDRLQSGCGKVALTAGRSSDSRLQAAEVPFEPELQLAIEFARDQLEKNGEFIGMLPAGLYSFGDTEFEVVPGRPAKLALSRSTPASLPRWNIRSGLGMVHMGASPEGLGPKSFWAGGGTAGIGVQKGLGGLVFCGELNLHGAFHPSGHLVGSSAVLRTGYRWNRFSLSAGPLFNYSHGKRMGILPAELERACPGCENAEEMLDSSVLVSWPRSTGGVLDAEISLDGWGLSIRGGARTDGIRWYQEAGTLAVFRFGEVW
jgi:hypothetical protein